MPGKGRALPLPTSGRVWVISELYHPEFTSTGHLLTRIAEGLRAQFPVHVLCAPPTYAMRGTRVPRQETRNGVLIRRVISVPMDNRKLAGKLWNAITISSAMFVTALRQLRRGDVALVVTNPPLLPFVIAAACKVTGARCLLLIHDVYPDVMVVSRWLPAGSILHRFADALTRALYRSTSGIIVLGRDMAHRVTVKDPTLADRITVVPNWAELEQIEDRPYAPRAHGLRVQYAGNIGRTHDFATLLEAAPRLAADGSDVHFEILGDGTRRKWLEREVAARRLSNVTIAPPGADRGFRHLAQADVALITLAAGMPGVSVPSRMYNALAAARPIIAVAEADSELARVVREEQVGWVVAPGDVAGFAATISEARRSPELLQNMSRRARAAALRNYSFERSLMGYNRAVAALLHTEQVNAYEPS